MAGEIILLLCLWLTSKIRSGLRVYGAVFQMPQVSQCNPHSPTSSPTLVNIPTLVNMRNLPVLQKNSILTFLKGILSCNQLRSLLPGLGHEFCGDLISRDKVSWWSCRNPALTVRTPSASSRTPHPGSDESAWLCVGRNLS